MKIGIVGCAGRMGRLLVAEVLARPDCTLAGGTERPGSEAIGRDVGTLAGAEPAGLMVGDDAAALFAAADVVVDFTSPAAPPWWPAPPGWGPSIMRPSRKPPPRWRWSRPPT
jgi:4-hydroxy-tetrahydrodipicolinate reductase